MLNPREVQDVIDDVLGNKKDPLRMTRDFLKQVSDYEDRVQRLGKRLEAQRWEKEQCGSNWASAYSVLERIEESERLVQRAKELYAAVVSEVADAIDRLCDKDQRIVLRFRYIACVSDWERIAAMTGKSKAEVRRIHSAALLKMRTVLEEMKESENDL